jgi:hypothetical protein
MIPWSHEINLESGDGLLHVHGRIKASCGGDRGLYARVGEVEHGCSLGLAIKPKEHPDKPHQIQAISYRQLWSINLISNNHLAI